MRGFQKKLIILGVMTVTVLTVLTACTKTVEKREDAETTEEDEPRPEGVASKETPETVEDGNGEVPEAENKDAQEGNSEAASGSGKTSDGEETELNGMIEEIPAEGDDSFVIAKLVTEQINGIDIIGTDPDDTKITVVCSADTVFVKQTVRDGGNTTEETEGSAADLQEGFTVEMKGSYDGENVFLATDVRIVEVIL